MTTTTAKGYQYPAGTDTVTSYPPLAQNNALLEDARPGISVVTTTARNAYTGIDLWDGRIIWNTTTLQLEKYDLGTTSWIAAAAPSAVIPATSVVGPPAFGASSVVGTSTSYARADHVHGAPSIATYAPLASPALTGLPTTPTQAALDNSTKIASTAYVDTAVGVETTARTTAVSAEQTRALAAEALLMPKANINAVLTSVMEGTYITSTPPAATMNIDVTTNPTDISITANATNNWVFNFRSTSSATFNSLLVAGQSITIAVEVQQGSTPYYCTAINIDSTLQTVNWQGGLAPTTGYASGVDVYVIKILKLAANSYRVLASLSQF